MKANVINGKDNFTPVRLEILFESQKEVDTFYCIFNYVPITETLREMGMLGVDKNIRKALESLQNYSATWEPLTSGIEKRCKAIKDIGSRM